MNIGQERAEFEVWRRKHYDYEDLTAFEIKFAFAAFQAGRAVLQAESETYVEALEEALSDLIAACPINLNCCDFHHVKADQHDHDEACRPMGRYYAAIEQAQRRILSEEGSI